MKKNIGLIFIIIFAAVARWLPNLIAPVKNFGYDYGFYLYNLNHTKWSSLFNFAKSAWDGYGNILFPIVHLLNIPSELFLQTSQVLLAVITAMAFYLFWHKENRQAAIWSGILYILSVAQTQLYLMFLWKNLLGLIFIILTYKFLKENRYRLAALTAALTLISHRTSAVVLALGLGIYGIYMLISQRYYKILALIGSAFAGTAYWWFPFLQNEFNIFNTSSNLDVSAGIFLSNADYLVYSLPLLILAAGGLIIYKFKRQHLPLHVLAGVIIIWIILQLPFHNRLWPYFDIVLIIYGGYFLATFPITTAKRIVAYGLMAIIILLNFHFTLSQQPLISQTEIQEIQNFQSGNPETLVLALSAADAPWLLGYLQDSRIAAPGLFENRHSQQEWQNFWDEKDQITFLTRYPRPLVLYQRSEKPSQELYSCAPLISPNFLRYECKQKLP